MYRVYADGVFDMFHIGHLNIIVKSRARCDRLIVGAVTDEVAKEKFPEGWRADKPYLRWVPAPKG